MPKKSSGLTFSALTRAYQRNVRSLLRATPAARKALKKTATASRMQSAALRCPVRAAGGELGRWLAGAATGPAGARRYHLYIPPGLLLHPKEKLPLMVMLHGCRQTGRDLAASSRMNRLAARERFLVLYPEQEAMANAQGCWNWFECRNHRAQAEAATLLAVIDKAAARQPVDRGCIAVAGLSAGAGMAALMAALYPHRFCAVGMHSGVAPGAAVSAATALAAMQGRREPHLPQPIAEGVRTAAPQSTSQHTLPPLLVVHGDADRLVSVRNAFAAAALWADALGARAGPVRKLQRGHRYAMQATDYKVRGGAVVVALRTVQGLAHAWSGGAANMPFSDPAGPDACALLWAFVSRQFSKNMKEIGL